MLPYASPHKINVSCHFFISIVRKSRTFKSYSMSEIIPYDVILLLPGLENFRDDRICFFKETMLLDFGWV